jgi:NAD-dependent dihydropyrimidine dehydrogenase PreA subunit
VSEALFINVEVSPDVRGDAELARKLEEVCPVDIFKAVEPDDAGGAQSGGAGSRARAKPAHVEIVDENLDECVLCELCINASPPGTVKVIKLYDGGAVLGA